MTEFRATFNHRLTADMNVSLTVSHIVSDPQEADQAGFDSALMVTSFLAGYIRASEQLDAA